MYLCHEKNVKMKKCNNVKMRKEVLTLMLCALCAMTAVAQEKTLLVAESGLPYTEQTWFAYGEEPIRQQDIVGCWDQGKRITTASYTSEGWFVIMAKNTGYTMQTYQVCKEWPEAWVAEKSREGYAITALSHSDKEWLVVLSQGSGISHQVVWQNTWENLEPWIAEQKTRGYCITSLAYDGYGWMVVMSLGSPYTSQGYFVAKSTNEMMLNIPTEIWNKGFNLHQVEFGGGKYIVTYGNYARGDERFQNLQVNPDNPKEYIKEQWDKGIYIAYIGGGSNRDEKKK